MIDPTLETLSGSFTTLSLSPSPQDVRKRCEEQHDKRTNKNKTKKKKRKVERKSLKL